MNAEIKVKKWGNSLAIRVPNAFVKEYNFDENSSIKLDGKKDKIIIQKINKKQDFLHWFANSPVANLDMDMDIKRDKSLNRNIEL